MRLSNARPILPYAPRSSLRAAYVPRRSAWRSAGEPGPAGVGGRGPLARSAQLAIVEAVLFVADEPLTPRRLAQAAGLQDGHDARRLTRRLNVLYEQDGAAFRVEEVAGGFQLLTQPEFRNWLARWRQSGPEVRLSAAARETLAIVAYRQPIMRADIEELRGVQCGELLRLLMEKGLVRIAGRHPSLGRPVLYATTRKFLQLFGLRDLEELPQAEHLRRPAGAVAAHVVQTELEPPRIESQAGV